MNEEPPQNQHEATTTWRPPQWRSAVVDFHHTLKRVPAELLESGVALAVSGGADSVFLLHVAADYAERSRLPGGPPHIIHVHHGLRGAEADADAYFVREQAGLRGLPCTVEHVRFSAEDRLPGEAEMRSVRYRAIHETMLRMERRVLLVGHTASDQAETLVMRMIRGTGVEGLAGMLPTARFGRFLHARPMLLLKRDEVRRMLREAGIPWREDATNAQLGGLRNRVRLEIMPLLEQAGHGRVVEHLNQLSIEAAALVEDRREELEEQIARQHLWPMQLELTPLRSLTSTTRRRLLLAWLQDATKTLGGNPANVRRAHVLEAERYLRLGDAAVTEQRRQPARDWCRVMEGLLIHRTGDIALLELEP